MLALALALELDHQSEEEQGWVDVFPFFHSVFHIPFFMQLLLLLLLLFVSFF